MKLVYQHRGNEKDDFKIGNSFGGDLRPGIIAFGGVNVDNLPTTLKNIKIILETYYIGEYSFDVILQ